MQLCRQLLRIASQHRCCCPDVTGGIRGRHRCAQAAAIVKAEHPSQWLHTMYGLSSMRQTPCPGAQSAKEGEELSKKQLALEQLHDAAQPPSSGHLCSSMSNAVLGKVTSRPAEPALACSLPRRGRS